MNRLVALPVAVLCAALVAGCASEHHSSTAKHADGKPSASPSADVWRFHPSIANNIDPRKVVSQAEAQKLLDKKMPHADTFDSDPNAKDFPTNTRRVIYSNRTTSEFTYDAKAWLTVTTMVVDKSLNQPGWTYGRNDCDTGAYGSSGVQLRGLDPNEIGLPTTSRADIELALHGLADAKHYYPSPTKHDLAFPYGIYVWGNQQLANGKTRPVRFTIFTESTQINRKDLLNLAAKAAKRMNLK